MVSFVLSCFDGGVSGIGILFYETDGETDRKGGYFREIWGKTATSTKKMGDRILSKAARRKGKKEISKTNLAIWNKELKESTSFEQKEGCGSELVFLKEDRKRKEWNKRKVFI